MGLECKASGTNVPHPAGTKNYIRKPFLPHLLTAQVSVRRREEKKKERKKRKEERRKEERREERKKRKEKEKKKKEEKEKGRGKRGKKNRRTLRNCELDADSN
jgi:response regulator RpfG family c-di-GMP phosphodiesterase